MASFFKTATATAARFGFLLGFICLFPACHFGTPRVVKTQGICVVAENAEAVTVNAMESQEAAGYVPQPRFGPKEQPLAVVVGYGGQDVRLQLVDSATGRLLGTKVLESGPGESMFQPLLLETSGDYELRLLVDGTQRDVCRFLVTRNPTTAASAPAAGTNADGSPVIPETYVHAETHFPDYDVNLRNRLTPQETKQLLNATNAPEDTLKTVK